ncbi:hypothetical protein RCL1_003686 [Eukaryota sp. TZLM3-RCL]
MGCSSSVMQIDPLAAEPEPSEPIPTPNLRKRLDSIHKSVRRSQVDLIAHSGSSLRSSSIRRSSAASVLSECTGPCPSSLSNLSDEIILESICSLRISGKLSSGHSPHGLFFSCNATGSVVQEGSYKTSYFSLFIPQHVSHSNSWSSQGDLVLESVKDYQNEWILSIKGLNLEGNSDLIITTTSPDGYEFSTQSKLPIKSDYNVFTKSSKLIYKNKLNGFILRTNPKKEELRVPVLPINFQINELELSTRWTSGEFLFIQGNVVEIEIDEWSGSISDCLITRYGTGWKLSSSYQISISRDYVFSIHFPVFSSGENESEAIVEVVTTRFCTHRQPPSLDVVSTRGNCRYQSNLTEEGELSLLLNGEISDSFRSIPISLEFIGKIKDQMTAHLDSLCLPSWEIEADQYQSEMSQLISTGKYEEAEKIGVKYWQLLKSNVDPHHDRVGVVTRLIGECLINQNKLSKAEALLRHSVSIIENCLDLRFDDDNLNNLLAESLYLLGKCCNLQDKPKEALFFLLMAEDAVNTKLPMNKIIEFLNGIKISTCFDDDVLNKVLCQRQSVLKAIEE